MKGGMDMTILEKALLMQWEKHHNVYQAVKHYVEGNGYSVSRERFRELMSILGSALNRQGRRGENPDQQQLF